MTVRHGVAVALVGLVFILAGCARREVGTLTESGIAGTITRTCENRSGESHIRRQVRLAHLELEAPSGAKLSVQPDSEGNYSTPLDPGTYLMRVVSPLGFCCWAHTQMVPLRVNVAAGRTTRLDILLYSYLECEDDCPNAAGKWLLMRPAATRYGGDKKPLLWWRAMACMDTGQQCEAERRKEIASMDASVEAPKRPTDREPAYVAQIRLDMADQARRAICIPNDDSRLRSNQPP